MFGISTFCLHRRPLPEALDELASLTDLVEVMDDGPHFVESPDLLESYDLRYSLHAPSRGVNIASLLPPIRRASVEVIAQAFSVAAEVGAGVVIHPGYFAWQEEREPATRSFAQSLREITAEATERGVRFTVENMGNWDYFFLRFPDELPLLDGNALALDVGHAHLNGCLPGFLAHPAAHVHLHDNDGQKDTHAETGAGTIDFRPVLQAIRRDHATAVIEVDTLPGVLASLRYLDSLGN